MDRRIALSLRIGIEAGASALSWMLVNWIAPKLFGQSMSNILCGAWVVLCIRDRIWNISPRSPEQLTQMRGVFWTIVPLPTPIIRYNIWAGLITEMVLVFSVTFTAHFVLQSLVSSQLANSIGHAFTLTALSNRPFDLNPPLVLPDTTNSVEGIMWKFIGMGLQKSAHMLLVYASTPAKRRRRARRTTNELVPFPDVFPVDILREILDATLHQIWEETDQMRDPEFSDVLSLMLTCRDFKGWVYPQFYQYVHVANPTRVGQLARCLVLTINTGDGSRQLWQIPKGQELVNAYMERAPRIRALSLGDFTWTLHQHLNDFTVLSLMLPHLQRLNIHWSLLDQLRKKPITFHAAQITMVMDAQPPEHIGEITAQNSQPILVRETIGIRFAFPLDAGGKVPPAHRRICSFIDPTFVNQDATKKLAIELYIEDEVDAEQTKRAKSTLPVFLRLGDNFASIGKYTRIVFIVWVGDEEYENWVDPQPDGELTEIEKAIQETFEKAKEEVGPQNTEGIVSFVPLRKRELSQWSFSVLERKGLDFWEEIEKRFAERVAS